MAYVDPNCPPLSNYTVSREELYEDYLELGHIADKRAIEPLLVALQDWDENVSTTTAQALKEVTGQYFGKDHRHWDDWWKTHRGNL